MILRPFWRYYGGKWRLAPTYPSPTTGTVIEPFAGAAGYALRHYQRDVILVEKYPIVAAIWRYLIGASRADILAIPLVDHVADLPSSVTQEARWLVGMTMSAGAVSPNRRISSGMAKMRDAGRHTEGWGIAMRARAAAQVDHIRHWRLIEGDYTAAPNVEATWFVDPPYQVAGKHYVHNSTKIDYAQLAGWCLERRTQAIVCEARGATWLPFESHWRHTNGIAGRASSEVVWIRGGPAQMTLALPHP